MVDEKGHFDAAVWRFTARVIERAGIVDQYVYGTDAFFKSIDSLANRVVVRYVERNPLRADLVEVTGPMEILPDVYTTGQMGSGIVEQALVVRTGAGSVIVTGCAHPGIEEMVRKGKEVTTGGVTLAMGGFHLGGTNQWQIKDIIAEFRRLGVRCVAPCHCTGDRARRMFAIAFGPNCTLSGVGWVASVGDMYRWGRKPKTGLLHKLLTAFRRASGHKNGAKRTPDRGYEGISPRLHAPVGVDSGEYGG